MFISNWWIKACIFFKSCPTPVQMCSDLPLLVRPGYCLSVSLIDRPDILCPRPHCPILTSDWSSSLFPSSSLLRLQSDSKFCPLIIFLLWTLVTADWAAAALLSSSILSLHHGFVSFCYWFFSLSFVQFFPSCFFPSFCHYFFIFFLLNSFPPHFVLSSPSFFCDSFPYSLNSIPSYFPLSFLPSIISFFSFIPSYWPCSLPVFLFFPELTVIIHFYDFIFISISFFSNMFCFFLDSSLVPSLHLLFSQLFLPVSMLHWPECDQRRAEFGWIERQLTVLSIQIQWYCKTRCGLKGRISFVLLSIHVTVCSDQSMSFSLVCSFFNSGTIVSVGDPKKKYTRFEKIGQGWAINPSCISSLLKLVLVQFHLFVIFTLLFIW